MSMTMSAMASTRWRSRPSIAARTAPGSSSTVRTVSTLYRAACAAMEKCMPMRVGPWSDTAGAMSPNVRVRRETSERAAGDGL